MPGPQWLNEGFRTRRILCFHNETGGPVALEERRTAGRSRAGDLRMTAATRGP
ncbi:hypothetical protein GCM10012285_17290 [Streptomyces kronopolitis]|uniref:Uncharacterized protein n=1 Tax=Streptomyces kronopolitis TaxID=1612435 RepID=A0ABQ2J7Q7_9ACTN|nr:hypothetical protein GCM10012285_17290 [Streptomyces kronopolitis]